MNGGTALHSLVGSQVVFLMKRWKLNRSHLQQFYLVMVVSCQKLREVVSVLRNLYKYLILSLKLMIYKAYNKHTTFPYW